MLGPRSTSPPPISGYVVSSTPDQRTSQLFIRRDAAIDPIDEIELKWGDAYVSIFDPSAGSIPRTGLIIILDIKEKQTAAALFANKVNEMMMVGGGGEKQYETLIMALLFAILSSLSLAQATPYYQQLISVMRDNLPTTLLRSICDRYNKLLDQPRAQLLWFINELLVYNASEVDLICQALLRQIIGGNIDPKNLWLCDRMLQIFSTHKEWLYRNTSLIPFVFYTFTRMIIDHYQPVNMSLRQAEISLVSSLVNEKFLECSAVGRDGLRLLQEVSKIPEFEAIWAKLLTSPTSLSPTLSDVSQLLHVETPKQYLQSRLTPEMESQLIFMMQDVKMGCQRTYQHWFQQRYLNSELSESLIVDLIRYTCCVWHPTHQTCSNVVPRWAMIGWLVTCIQNDWIAAQAKLALFYDWLYFDPKKNIMNIEPAILLIYHSIPKYAGLSATLLEFLLFLIENYDPPHRENLLHSVQRALEEILRRNFLQKYDPIFAHPFDLELMHKIKTTFAPFYKAPSLQTSQKSSQQLTSQQPQPLLSAQPRPLSPPQRLPLSQHILPSQQLQDQSQPSEYVSQGNQLVDHQKTEPAQDKNRVEQPLTQISQSILSLKGVFLQDPTPFTLYQLLTVFVNEATNLDSEQRYMSIKDVAKTLLSRTEAEFQDCTPQTVVCRYGLLQTLFHMCIQQTPNGPQLGLLHSIIKELRNYNSLATLRYFCFLISTMPNGVPLPPTPPPPVPPIVTLSPDQVMSAVDGDENGESKLNNFYIPALEMCKPATTNISELVVSDICRCVDFNRVLFLSVVPFAYLWLPSHTVGNAQLFYALLSVFDPFQMFAFTKRLLTRQIQIFGPDFFSIVEASTSWESFEQNWMWQLLVAEYSHNNPQNLESLVQWAVGKANTHGAGDIWVGIVNLCKDATPTKNLVHILLTQPFSALTSTILLHWSISPHGPTLRDCVSGLEVDQSIPAADQPKIRDTWSKLQSSLASSQTLSKFSRLCPEPKQSLENTRTLSRKRRKFKPTPITRGSELPPSSNTSTPVNDSADSYTQNELSVVDTSETNDLAEGIETPNNSGDQADISNTTRSDHVTEMEPESEGRKSNVSESGGNSGSDSGSDSENEDQLESSGMQTEKPNKAKKVKRRKS